eukprot:scaffold32044_cov30-Tisochrysis_lutea.AAC.1
MKRSATDRELAKGTSSSWSDMTCSEGTADRSSLRKPHASGPGCAGAPASRMNWRPGKRSGSIAAIDATSAPWEKPRRPAKGASCAHSWTRRWRARGSAPGSSYHSRVPSANSIGPSAKTSSMPRLAHRCRSRPRRWRSSSPVWRAPCRQSTRAMSGEPAGSAL